MGIAKNLLITVIAIPVLFTAGSYIRNKAVGPEGWAMDNTETRLRQQFKDPESVVIRSSRTISTVDPDSRDATIHICGTVDGKNSFGAYPGAVRFVSRSVSRSNTFDTYSVEVEDPRETEVAHSVDRRSGFEKVYWDPNCEVSSKST